MFGPLIAWHVATGCSEGPSGTQPSSVPGATRTGDTLVIGEQHDIGTLISILPQTVTDGYLIDATTLSPLDGTFDCSLRRLPGLARSWAWNDEGTILAMELRDDLSWEDGVRVTTDDIAFTYDLVADPVVGSRFIRHVEHMEPDGRPRIVDATHIEWHFTHAYDRDIQMVHANLPPLPKHLFFEGADRATLRGHERAKLPLSYGPWRMATWEPNQRVVLEPNLKFTGPETFRPRLDRVIFRVIPEYATRLLELESGSIDVMTDIGIADADRLRQEHSEVRLVRRGWRSMEYIVWNLQNPLFRDARVRRALTMATDIQGTIDKLLTSETGESYARPAVGTVTPALCGIHNDEIATLPYDVAAAKKLLAEVGWTDHDGDGVLDKNGTKLEFSLVTTTGNKRRADASVLIQDQMRHVGVSVRLERVETNAFYTSLRERRFEAALAGRAVALTADPGGTWMCDEAGARNEVNYSGYCNPTLDALVEKAFATQDVQAGAAIWKEVQRILYEDQPFTFLWWMDEVVGIHDRFEHTTISITSPYKNLYEWKVPAEKVKYPR